MIVRDFDFVTGQLSDEGKLTGLAVGVGEGLGASFQTTQWAKGTPTSSLRAIREAVMRNIESARAQFEELKRQAIQAMIMPGTRR